jgi:hypothetical protein
LATIAGSAAADIDDRDHLAARDLEHVGDIAEAVRQREVTLRKLLKQVLWMDLPTERSGGKWGRYHESLQRGIEGLQALDQELPKDTHT